MIEISKSVDHKYLWRRVDVFLNNVAYFCQTISRPCCRVSEADYDLVPCQQMLLQHSLPPRLKVAHMAGEGVGESL